MEKDLTGDPSKSSKDLGDCSTEAIHFLDLIDELCRAHAPSGLEREIDEIIERRLASGSTKIWQDAARNTIAFIPGKSCDRPLQITAHKDEIALIVKRIEDDGRLTISRVGGIHPFKIGEGPVDVLADDGTVVPAILGFGAAHVSDESLINEVKTGKRAAQWSDAIVDPKISKEELRARGVHVGSRVTLDRSRKSARILQGHVCAHALDDRGALALLISLSESLAVKQPPQDVYLLFTSGEEVESGASSFGSRNIPGDTLVAVEIIPVMPEYDLENDHRPVVLWADSRGPYDVTTTNKIITAAGDSGIEIQEAVLASFGSDAALARRTGAVPQSACLGFPTENSHGYEVAHLGGMLNCGRLLEAFVHSWSP